jgi:hypothetical protein
LTWDKQSILDRFIIHLKVSEKFKDGVDYIWLNAGQIFQNSFKWMRTGTVFNLTNWFPNYPTSKNGHIL